MSLKLNERYPGRFDNPSADYPQGSFKNRTTPVAKDGSYLEKDWANDKEGFFQSLLQAAGIVPSGDVDKVGASQFFDAILKLNQDQAGRAFTTGGAAPSFTLTPTPAIPAYATSQRFSVKFNAAGGVNPTLNVSGKGAKNLKQYDSTGSKIAAVIVTDMISDVEYDGTDMVVLDPLTTDLTNAARIDVASAATVNLTASAPATRNIRITGTAAITAFTLAIGQVYFVSFAGICTLTNNAAIVTNSGGNIVTAAGDSCVIRATAANVVEVLYYTRGIPQALGDGQTLQNVTASRALNTNRTNNTGRPIFVTARAQTDSGSASGNRMGLQLDGGAEYYGAGTPGSGSGYPLCVAGIVTKGAVYRININNAALLDWSEMTL